MSEQNNNYPQHPDQTLEEDYETRQSALGPAEELGLVDGNFPVRRSDDTIDTGWTIQKYEEIINPKTKLPEKALFISRSNPDRAGEILEKVVRYSEVTAIIADQAERQKQSDAIDIGKVALSSILEDEVTSHERSRKKILFKPYSLVVEPSSPKQDSEDGYDWLFDDNYVAGSVEDAAVRKPEFMGRGVATSDSEKYTLDIVMKRFADNGKQKNSEIAKIINKYLRSGDVIGSRKSMLEIRNNADLRYELGDFFLKRQELYKDALRIGLGKTVRNLQILLAMVIFKDSDPGST